jgi:hypothetical protein
MLIVAARACGCRLRGSHYEIEGVFVMTMKSELRGQAALNSQSWLTVRACSQGLGE